MRKMKHEAQEDVEEDPAQPLSVVAKNIGRYVLDEFERDTFLDGLSLGVWDEDFGYYKPMEEK